MDEQHLMDLMVETYIENQIKVKPYQRKTPQGKLIQIGGYQKGGQAAQQDQPSERKKVKKPTSTGGAGPGPSEDERPKVASIGDLFKEYKNTSKVPEVIPLSAQVLYRDYVSNMAIIRELVKETRNIDAARKDSRYKDLVQEQASLLLDFFREIEDAQKQGEKTGKTKTKQ